MRGADVGERFLRCMRMRKRVRRMELLSAKRRIDASAHTGRVLACGTAIGRWGFEPHTNVVQCSVDVAAVALHPCQVGIVPSFV